jgi:hypothetical protein
MILTGENWRTRRKTCTSAISSTTNPTWTDPGANLGLRGERLATNCSLFCLLIVFTFNFLPPLLVSWCLLTAYLYKAFCFGSSHQFLFFKF